MQTTANSRWSLPRAGVLLTGLGVLEAALLRLVGPVPDQLRAVGRLGDPTVEPVSGFLDLLAVVTELVAAYLGLVVFLRMLAWLPGASGRLASSGLRLVTVPAVRRILDGLVGGALLAQLALSSTAVHAESGPSRFTARPVVATAAGSALVASASDAAVQAPARTVPLPPWVPLANWPGTAVAPGAAVVAPDPVAVAPGAAATAQSPTAVGGSLAPPTVRSPTMLPHTVTPSTVTPGAPVPPPPVVTPGPRHAPAVQSTVAGAVPEPGEAAGPGGAAGQAGDAGASGATAGAGAPEAHHRRRYTIRPGDTLWGIATAHLPAESRSPAQVTRYWRQIYAANRTTIGADPDLIHPGTLLVIPSLHPVPAGHP